MFRSLLVSLILFINFSLYSYQLSICAIFQNESRFLKEWIDYHRKVGVEHFWLYNNNSTDDYIEILKPYVQEGVVELIQWPSVQYDNDWQHHSFEVQTGAYNDAILRSRGISKWLALIDLDEFIVPVCENNVLDVLEKHFPQVSGLCVNWQCFGTSNVKEIFPNESMLKKLTWKMNQNNITNYYFKSIIKPSETLRCVNPHYCIYIHPHWHVNPNLDRFDIVNTGVFIDKIRINHYWSKDEKFFYEVKLPRHQKWDHSLELMLNLLNQMNQEEDTFIHKFLD